MRIRCPQKTSHPPPSSPSKRICFQIFTLSKEIPLRRRVFATTVRLHYCAQSLPLQVQRGQAAIRALQLSWFHLDFSRCLSCSIHSYQYEERLIEIALIGQYITSLQSHWHNRRRQLQSHYKLMTNNGILNRRNQTKTNGQQISVCVCLLYRLQHKRMFVCCWCVKGKAEAEVCFF